MLSDANETVLYDLLSAKFSEIHISSTYRSELDEAKTILQNILKNGFMHQLHTYGKEGDSGLVAYFKQLVKDNAGGIFREYEAVYKEFHKMHLESTDTRTMQKNLLTIAKKFEIHIKTLDPKKGKDQKEVKKIKDLVIQLNSLKTNILANLKAIEDPRTFLPELKQNYDFCGIILKAFPTKTSPDIKEFPEPYRIEPSLRKICANSQAIQKKAGAPMFSVKWVFDQVHKDFQNNKKYDIDQSKRKIDRTGVVSKYHASKINLLEISNMIYCEAVDNFMRKYIPTNKQKSIERMTSIKTAALDAKQCCHDAGFISAHSHQEIDVADIPILILRNGNSNGSVPQNREDAKKLLKGKSHIKDVRTENNTLHVEFTGNPTKKEISSTKTSPSSNKYK